MDLARLETSDGAFESDVEGIPVLVDDGDGVEDEGAGEGEVNTVLLDVVVGLMVPGENGGNEDGRAVVGTEGWTEGRAILGGEEGDPGIGVGK